jgi:hypothetical protein
MQHPPRVQVVHGSSHTQRQPQHCRVVRPPCGSIVQQARLQRSTQRALKQAGRQAQAARQAHK